MSDAKFDQGTDDEYMPYVLYTKPGDSNCNAVVKMINQHSLHSNIFIADATQKRPQWLKGVPTLYCVEGKKVVAGAHQIMQYLPEIRKNELSSYGASNMSAPGSVSFSASSLFAEGMFSIEGDPAPGAATSPAAVPSAGFEGSGQPRGARAQRRAAQAAATDSAVEQYNNTRLAFDRRIQAKQMQHSNVHAPRPMMQPPAPPTTHHRQAY